VPEALVVRDRQKCRWDQVSLGEVMLRLDPGDVRVATARSFSVWEGGGEYNVARTLRACFGLRTAVVTAFADNPVGRLLEGLVLQSGVDMSHVIWAAFDGIGRNVRNGLNFTERGFGVRAALGCSDRANSAASQLGAGQVNWHQIFSSEGARWFHTGGIFAGLSGTTPECAEEAMAAARRAGTVVSYDINYRPSLWNAVGGTDRAVEVNRRLVALADVLFGNEEDFTAGLGFEVSDAHAGYASLDPESYAAMMARVAGEFPNIKLIATSLREVRTASRNHWAGTCWSGGEVYFHEMPEDIEIYDRVGGGDGFATGLIYGVLTGKALDEALRYGVAHGALAMTTPGDTSMATLADVTRLVGGGTARVVR
jgi:2-dehydro-3-deoxygluconokinase